MPHVSTVRTSRLWALAFLAGTALSLAPTVAAAQDGAWDSEEVLARKEFTAPPATIADAAMAPRYLNVTSAQLNATREWFLKEISDGPVTMDVFSKPFHELGGQFIDYQANRSRSLTIRNNAGLDVISAADGRRISVEVPDGARISASSMSPDGSKIAFFAHFDDATHIYVADPSDGESRRITRTPVLATLVTGYEWTADGEAIVTVLVPENRAPMPVEPSVPMGPEVKITEDGENRLRTYASLMATPFDEDLLEWHATGQLAKIDVDSRDVERIGAPTMIRSIDPSPTGEYHRVTRMVKPFSYIVPVNSFGRIEEIWDSEGTMLAALDTTELNTGISDGNGGGGRGGNGGNQAGKRSLTWRADGQGLSYLEQEAPPEDDEDQPAGAEEREDEEEGGARRPDRVYQWLPPFDDDSKVVVYESNRRLQGVAYSEDHQTLFLTTRQGSNMRQFAVFLDDPETEYTLVERDTEDFYDNPGSLLNNSGSVGGGGRGGFGGGGSRPVQMSGDGSSVFLAGTTYNEDPLSVAPQAFIDRVDIRTGDTERIFEGDNEGAYSTVAAIIDIDAADFIIERESPTEVPQLYRGGTQLTENVDYTPDLTNAPKERFTVERPDGFKFRVNVTLPPGYREGTRLPAMFWFYPREYENQEDYDEGARTYNMNSFQNFGTRSIEYLVRLGYAVVEPDAPIVGPAGQMNNNYEHDLRNNLAAVIDELDRRELIDRSRLGLGGHSYGAFSTVNAMVHTPFFKAGIAGDGNYNRTFTPLAFQSERRFFWDAKDVYISMSPFMHANNLTGALLMYHGLQDQNVGTAPDHSPRLFHALNGLGKTASMYLYPFEDHGPATRETQLDLWARWTAWLDIYVKNSGQTETIISQNR